MVDGLLFAGGKTKHLSYLDDYTYAKYLIDPVEEALIAVFIRSSNSIFFLNEEPYWWGVL